MNQNSNSSRILRNTIYLYIKTFISMIVMLIATRIVLNSLGVIDYGIYNVVAGSITFLCFFQSTLSITMQRFLNHYQGENNIKKQTQVFNVGIVIHLAIGILLIGLFSAFGLVLFNGILNIPSDRIDVAKLVYVCLIINTFFVVITAPYDAAITAHENMLFYSVVGIMEAILKLGVAFIVMYTTMDKLLMYAILMMVIPILTTFIMRVYCKHHYVECSFHPQREYDKTMAKNMLSFAGWSLVGSSTNVISNHGANLALNHFFGAAINTVAGIAVQIQGLLAVAFTNLMKAMTPVIFKSEGAGNEKNMLSFSLLGCKYSTLLYVFLEVPVFIEAPYLLKLWLGVVPEWTVLFVRLQLIRAFFEQLCASLMNSLNASNHIKEINIISIFYNLAPIIILVFLYSRGFPPYWHYIIMIIIMVMGQNISMIYLCGKHCGLMYIDYINIVFKPAMVVTFSSFIVGLIVSLLHGGFLRLVICVVSTCSVAISMSYLMMDSYEKRRINEFVKMGRKKRS